jgi:hypothetical protein
MFNIITDPITYKSYNINSKKGKNIINNYLNFVQKGGNGDEEKPVSTNEVYGTCRKAVDGDKIYWYNDKNETTFDKNDGTCEDKLGKIKINNEIMKCRNIEDLETFTNKCNKLLSNSEINEEQKKILKQKLDDLKQKDLNNNKEKNKKEAELFEKCQKIEDLTEFKNECDSLLNSKNEKISQFLIKKLELLKKKENDKRSKDASSKKKSQNLFLECVTSEKFNHDLFEKQEISKTENLESITCSSLITDDNLTENEKKLLNEKMNLLKKREEDEKKKKEDEKKEEDEKKNQNKADIDKCVNSGSVADFDNNCKILLASIDLSDNDKIRLGSTLLKLRENDKNSKKNDNQNKLNELLVSEILDTKSLEDFKQLITSKNDIFNNLDEESKKKIDEKKEELKNVNKNKNKIKDCLKCDNLYDFEKKCKSFLDDTNLTNEEKFKLNEKFIDLKKQKELEKTYTLMNKCLSVNSYDKFTEECKLILNDDLLEENNQIRLQAHYMTLLDTVKEKMKEIKNCFKIKNLEEFELKIKNLDLNEKDKEFLQNHREHLQDITEMKKNNLIFNKCYNEYSSKKFDSQECKKYITSENSGFEILEDLRNFPEYGYPNNN